MAIKRFKVHNISKANEHMQHHALMLIFFGQLQPTLHPGLTVMLNSKLRMQRALELIAQYTEGQMKMVVLNPTDTDEMVQIRWTTRPRSSYKKAEAAHPTSRERLASSAPSINSEPGSKVDIHEKECSIEVGEDDIDHDECAVCLSRAPDCALRPCGHARCCRRCVVETVCTWRQAGPPRCSLCRAPFHTMDFLV